MLSIKSGRYIGVMSGTSLDGVDVVLAAIDERMVAQQASYSHPIPIALKNAVLGMCQGQQVTLQQVGELDTQLGILFGEAVLGLLKSAGISPEEVTAIGCHGQTVWHQPKGDTTFSMQLGDNNRIAAMTGITTVGDFRRRDMAWGGQGAPLVPAFHQALLADTAERRMILNIGGIANLSMLLPGQPVRGYDTGPGNMLMDAWILRHKHQPYDKNAQWATQGRVNLRLLQQMLSDAYFAEPAPKSTGREYFNMAWLEKQLARRPRNLSGRCAGHADRTDGSQYCRTGSADRRLRSSDGVWRWCPKSVADGTALRHVARHRSVYHGCLWHQR